MSSSIDHSLSNANWILTSLPEGEYGPLLPHLETIGLPQGKTIYVTEDPIDYVYFPTSGMISLVSCAVGGETTQLATVGKEGMVGVSIILGTNTTPYQAEVHLQGDCMKMRADVLRHAFDRGGLLQASLLRYTHLLMSQIVQSAVCNRFHSVVQRLCRWLLVTRDHVNLDELQLTQEYLSYMMGSSRPPVSVAAEALQKVGLIRYKRGQILILDRGGLEAHSCECYRIVREQFDTLFNG